MGNIIQAMKNGDTKKVPMGILMVGPPGTGKTNLIHALARDMGIHIVRVKDISGSDWDIYRMSLVIRSLAPVIAFMDEIDKVGAPAESFIRFMSDPALRGKVLWVAASNKPDAIHPEFRRRGRLDDVVPFILPDSAEREDILKKLFSRNAIPYDATINFSGVASRTEYCSGADLEIIVMRSYQNARNENRDTVTELDLVRAVAEFIHDYEPYTYEQMMLLAMKEANFARLVPEPMHRLLRDKIYEDGRLSKAKINKRLGELKV